MLKEMEVLSIGNDEYEIVDKNARNDIEDIQIELTYKEKQTNLLSIYFKKIMSHENLIVNLQGDSIVYGADSNGTQSARSETTDNGAISTDTRANTTIPQRLQTIFNNFFQDFSVTINDLSFCGDTIENTLEHYTNNRNANLAICMFGINDSNPARNVNIESFLNNYRTLIKRYLDWNTAVIIVKPPRQKMSNNYSSNYIIPYSDSLDILSEEFNIPLIDGTVICNGFDDSYYSDNVHFNEKGYKKFADILFGIICNSKIKSKNFSVMQNYNLLANPNTEGINMSSLNTDYILFRQNSASINGKTNKVECAMNHNQKLIHSFYTEEDNMILIPLCSGFINCYLDIDGESPNFPVLNARKGIVPNFKIEGKTFSTDYYSSNTTHISDLINIIINEKLYINIFNSGYHSITFDGGTEGAQYSGFILTTVDDLKNMVYGYTQVCNATDTEIYINKNILNLLFHSQITSENIYGLPLNIIAGIPGTGYTEGIFILPRIGEYNSKDKVCACSYAQKGNYGGQYPTISNVEYISATDDTGIDQIKITISNPTTQNYILSIK